MSNMIKKNSLIRAGLSLVIAVLLTSIFKSFAVNTCVFEPSDFKLKNFLTESEDEHLLTATDRDARMTIEMKNPIDIRSIAIHLSAALDSEWKLQVFYASKGESYTEEKSIAYVIGENEKNIIVSLDENEISKLRIDWGDEGGKTFNVRNIIVNSKNRGLVFVFALLFFLFIYTVLYIKDYIAENDNSDEAKRIIASSIFCLIVFVIIAVAWMVNIYNGYNIFEKLFVYSEDVKQGVTITFTSLNFLFLFLPITVAIYYLLKRNFKNIFLLIASIIFYSVGEPVLVGLLLLSVFLNYVFGLFLAKEWCHKWIKNSFLILMLAWNLGLLFYYKYYAFTVENINLLTGADNIIPTIVQPLGISFFTFRTISFCLDVYWETVPVQYSFINVALYICFFPQVSMGPISKYNDFSAQLPDRQFDLELFLEGIRRIIIGLAKKLIVANNIGCTVDAVFAMEGLQRSVLLSWLGILSYLIQLYFDFSGYSDIAIGIGQLFGFKTPENFNYPYVSKSAAEFWSRWHITLGTWLKNYLYTPIFRTCQNKEINKATCNILGLLGVWLFAGIWHGAGWNFFFYGVYFFVLISLERIIEDYKRKKRKRLKIKKRPETLFQKIRAHIYFFFVVVFGMLFIRATNLTDFGVYFKSMFGLTGNTFCDTTTYFYWRQTKALFISGLILAFPVVDYVKYKMSSKTGEWILTIITPVIYSILLIVSVAFAMTDTYQSFIYFQF